MKSLRQKQTDRMDRKFSIYIRQRDSFDGYNRCSTCGIVKPWKELQCGHFMTRNHLSVRWEEKNAAVQCYPCNCRKGGLQFEMGIFLDKKFGEGTAEMIRIKSKNRVLVDYDMLELALNELIK